MRGGTRLKIIYLKKNQGHGIARRHGLEACNNEIVAIMDSDDICVSDRFEQQLRFFVNDETDIVGGDIAEFINKESNFIAYRNVPTNDREIKKYMKKRCPFNQMTVMFRKSSVIDAGGYLDWYCDEDYYLWIRMALKKYRMANTGTVLCHVRVGEDMYRRRGGWKYFMSEAKLQLYMYSKKIIDCHTFVINVAKRAIVQLMLPNRVRACVFKKFARERKNE